MWLRRGAIHLIAMFAMASASAGHAQSVSDAALVWDCAQQYDDRYHVRCEPRREQAIGLETPALQDGAQPGFAGLVEARDPRPVALRGEAVVFSAPAWRIPLHALPFDATFVTELLRSTLCGKAPACEIHYTLPEVRVFGGGRPSRARSRF